MGRRRALALVIVHVLFIAHLVHYRLAGSTLTPLEPSEAGHSIRNGAINAGAIFLVILVLSTLVLGRFFCGWACHLVAYQDACRWLLLKLGLKPKPVRTRLLLFVPLFAAFWLFVKPLIDRWREGDPAPALSVHLTTDDFWATFPGPLITVLTVLVCGGLAVWVLGAKGFCTYGCPYGGLFAIADRFAPGRIRVTDACDGAGQCTANCSSNVDVAREVRDYGMVVDPGCMKCLDCVAGCPNDALYFGVRGRPERNTRKERRRARRRQPRKPRKPFRRLAFLLNVETAIAVALAAAFSTFFLSWTAGVLVAAGLTVLAAVWVLLARPGSASSSFALPEEIFLACAFAACLAVLFDLYRMPFLLAIGLAVIAAYLLLLALRLFRVPRVRVQNLTLKDGGRLRGAGGVFLGLAVLGVAALVHGGLLQGRMKAAASAFRAAELARDGADQAAVIEAAATLERNLSWCDDWGVLPIRGLGRMMGEVERWRGRPEAALAWYQRESRHAKAHPELPLLRGLALLELGRADEARAAIMAALERRVAPVGRFLKLDWELARLGAAALRVEVLEEGCRQHPAEGEIAMRLCTLLVRAGDPALRDQVRALAVAEAVCRENGRAHAELLGLLAWLYGEAGQLEAAARAAGDSAAVARARGDQVLAADMTVMAQHYRARAAGAGPS